MIIFLEAEQPWNHFSHVTWVLVTWVLVTWVHVTWVLMTWVLYHHQITSVDRLSSSHAGQVHGCLDTHLNRFVAAYGVCFVLVGQPSLPPCTDDGICEWSSVLCCLPCELHRSWFIFPAFLLMTVPCLSRYLPDECSLSRDVSMSARFIIRYFSSMTEDRVEGKITFPAQGLLHKCSSPNPS